MHGIFYLVNQIFYLSRKLLGFGVDGGFSGQQKFSGKGSVFTIKNLKRCLLNASIDGRIDIHFSDKYILKTVLLIFLK